MNRVYVCCRIRPSSEDSSSPAPVLKGEDSHANGPNLDIQETVEVDGTIFSMDNVFDSRFSQFEIFSKAALPLINDLFDGINCTLFTYGQTGSGKTHTMQGSDSPDGRGIVPLTIEHIFARIATSTSTARNENLTIEETSKRDQGTGEDFFEVSLSILEIYQERLFDLLSTTKHTSPQTATPKLRIRENPGRGIWIEGLTESPLKSISEFNELYQSAMRRRTVASHCMNSNSSRSHVCVLLSLKRRNISTSACCSSKFHLIDLAGSEMVRKTDVSGKRLQEAKHINKSLSALGNVISALISNARFSSQSTMTSTTASISNLTSSLSLTSLVSHVPYRDSKLTRILQDSLSGESRIALILTVSASKIHVMESIATLRFGERAAQLYTSPKINAFVTNDVANNSTDLQRLKIALSTANREIQSLKKQLQQQLQQKQSQGKSSIGCDKCHCKCVSRPLPISVPTSSFTSTSTSTSIPISIVQPTNSVQPQTESGEIRCAVCGLDEDSSALLCRPVDPTLPADESNNEAVLGHLFMCDGNCGQWFHQRCCGLVAKRRLSSGGLEVDHRPPTSNNSCNDSNEEGEEGEEEDYDIASGPVGEWLCSSCTIEANEEEAQQSLSLPMVNSSISWTINENAMNSLVQIIQQQQQPPQSQSQYCEKTPWEAILSTLRSEYHTMRRERNRVLNQWREDRRLSAIWQSQRDKIDQDREQLDLQKDRQLCELTDEVNKLRREVEHGAAREKRLNQLNEELLVQVKSMRNVSQPINNRPPTAVESILATPIDRYYPTSRQSTKLGDNESDSSTRNDERLLGRSHAMPQLNHSSSLSSLPDSISSASSASSASLSSSLPILEPISQVNQGTGSTIPKPWLKKSAKLSSSSSSSMMDVSNRATDVSLLLSQSLPEPIRLLPSVVKGNTNISPIKSSSMRRINEDNANESQHQQQQQQQQQQQSSDENSLSNDGINTEPTLSFSSGKSFHLRLKELVSTVQAETGSFAEIRMKHKEREDERLALRSRGGGDRLSAYFRVSIEEKLSGYSTNSSSSSSSSSAATAAADTTMLTSSSKQQRRSPNKNNVPTILE